MSIQQFELYHGAVLARIVRNDRPVTLRLIESKAKQAWAAYIIDDEAVFYMKHNSGGDERKRDHVWTWSFSFNASQLSELHQLQQKRPVYLVLICGQREVGRDWPMEVCLLSPDKVNQCIDVGADSPQSIRVEAPPNRELHVYGPKLQGGNPLLVPRNALDNFGISRKRFPRD